MGIFYAVIAVLVVLSFLIMFFSISTKIKWISRGVIVACLLAAIIYEAIV